MTRGVKALYVTQQEILGQYKALQKTFSYVMNHADFIRQYVERHRFDSMTFSGCGSSFCLCKSAEASAKMRLGIPANSCAAGDVMINYHHYANLLKQTMLFLASRSGDTSEVVFVALQAKKHGIPIVGICAKENSKLATVADVMLEIPWAFDESVCQTRTVTNLYTVHLMILGILAKDDDLLKEIKVAIDRGENYIEQSMALLQEVSTTNFERAIVLADSELEGIASEGALAFKEISLVAGDYYHVLDVRHGPMVLINDQTLVIMVCSPTDVQYQMQLVADLRKKGAHVLTLTSRNADYGADWNVRLPNYQNFAVLGIPFIFVPQWIALNKALQKGINPDIPDGLDAYIELDDIS
jgi:fructoselysine-6-P-deglycase FrlB-like protein